MGFKVPTSPAFWASVKLESTGEDGRHIEGAIRVQFKRKMSDEVRQLLEDTKGKEVTTEIVEPLISDWKDCDDDNGAMPYTPENLKRLAQLVPGSPLNILMAFFKASAGAREGN